MSITYISNPAQSKELNVSRWIHTIDIIQLLKAGLSAANIASSVLQNFLLLRCLFGFGMRW
jgi:hypothetical protein